MYFCLGSLPAAANERHHHARKSAQLVHDIRVVDDCARDWGLAANAFSSLHNRLGDKFRVRELHNAGAEACNERSLCLLELVALGQIGARAWWPEI